MMNQLPRSFAAGTFVVPFALTCGVLTCSTTVAMAKQADTLPIPDSVTTIAIATESTAIKIEMQDAPALTATLSSANDVDLNENASLAADVAGEVMTVKAQDIVQDGYNIRKFFTAAAEPVLTVKLPKNKPGIGVIVTTRAGNVEVPEPLSVGSFVVTTSSGDIALSCITASDAVRISTDSGDVRVEKCLRSRVAELSTESGDLAANGAIGSVTASTESGNIALEVEGSAQTKSESGDIDLTVIPADGASIADTSSASESGNIAVKVPASADVSFDVTSESGYISTGAKRADGGRITQGSPEAKHKITLGTASGDIAITRM